MTIENASIPAFTTEPIAEAPPGAADDPPQPTVPDRPGKVPTVPIGESRASLTSREREVVALIAQGLRNYQIADRLNLSVRTVERHIENIYNRLGISGKAARAIVSAYAVRHGLAEFP